MKNYLNFEKIDRVNLPSESYFNENYALKSMPVAVTGLMDEWKAKTEWTSDFFKKRFGDLEQVAMRNKNRHDHKVFKIRDYFDYMENSNDDDPYYLKDSQFHLKTDIRTDYVAPPYFKSYPEIVGDKLLNAELSWMYIGAKNTFSVLHIDIFNTSAWNAVISGRKTWLFYPPDQCEYLASGINPFDPDLIRYPDFEKATPLVCTQNPGDVVFTPGGWWHAVYNEESGVSITENFVNQINCDTVKRGLTNYRKKQRIKHLKAPLILMQKLLKL